MCRSAVRRMATSLAFLVPIVAVLFAGDAVGGEAGASAPPVERFDLHWHGVHVVPNRGQWTDETVLYGLRSRGLDVAFRESSLTMHLRQGAGHSSQPLAITVTFPGSNPAAPAASDPLATRFHYCIGDDESRWQTDVPSFGRIVYENLYDGIDLHVMGSHDGVLKYEFHCDPGADHGRIRIHYDGIDHLRVDDNGDLLIETALGTLRDQAPVAWQENDRRRQDIPARFKVTSTRTYAISLSGVLNPTRSLVIDPELEWMTFLGGEDSDDGYGIAVDASGAATVVGRTQSRSFDGRINSIHGSTNDYDAFVLRLNAAGELVWMSYVGGRESDSAHGVALADNGDTFVAGRTESTDFTGRINSNHGEYYNDAFVFRIGADGTVKWMRYLGGESDDVGSGVGVDDEGRAVIAGWTNSREFEGRLNAFEGGTWDAFAVSVGPDGALDWMTYLGGSATDRGYGVAVDAMGRSVVVGTTRSTNFTGMLNHHRGGDEDAFAVVVGPQGEVRWMRYLGGSGLDDADDAAIVPGGGAVVVGVTESDNLQGRNNGRHGRTDAFATRLDANGTVLWGTYLGGSNDDEADAVSMDSTGSIIVAGTTGSTDFVGRDGEAPLVHDAFVAELELNGGLSWMGYVGGDGFDYAYDAAVGPMGDFWICGTTGSDGFSGRNNNHHGGSSDAFAVRLRRGQGPSLTVDAVCPGGGPLRVEWSGATPGGEVALLLARGTGAVVIPRGQPCAGILLGLSDDHLQLAWQGSSRVDGSGRLSRRAGPDRICGASIQLVDLVSCATSNVARIE